MRSSSFSFLSLSFFKKASRILAAVVGSFEGSDSSSFSFSFSFSGGVSLSAFPFRFTFTAFRGISNRLQCGVAAVDATI